MIARVFLSFGRSRPFPLHGLTAARLRRTRRSFSSWSRLRALSFCSFVGLDLSSLNSRTLDAGRNLKVKRAGGL
jgi:hypothetical protein